MREKNSPAVGLLMIGIAAIFLAGFFLLVVFGAQSYRNTVKSQNDNMTTRALQSYLSTAVKGSDRDGTVSVREDDTVGTELVIGDGSGYAIHIFHYNGQLMEDYAGENGSPSPERAQTIAQTDSFSVVLDGALLIVETDAGRALIHLRSGGDEK